MKLALFGLNVTVGRLQGAELVEHDRLIDLREQMFSQTPGLREDGRARFASVGQLADPGWTGEHVLRLVSSWPDVSAVAMTMIVSLAGHIASDGVTDPTEVTAWTHAILRTDSSGQVMPKPVVRAERAATGRSLPSTVNLWSAAAGSRQGGLAALAADLNLDDTRTQHPPETLP